MKHFLTWIAALALVTSCTGAGSYDRSSWMRELPDDTPACMMSIPGAHDACTAGVDEEYAFFRTQVLDIRGLWEAGVRSFDVRPTSRGDHLGVFHQIADTHVTFESVIGTLASCLEENPSEFAVVIFRHEDDADLSDNFASLMGDCLKFVKSGGLAADFRDDITLGELRGHILFLSRTRYEDGPVGAYLEGWPDRCEIVNAQGARTPMTVQDYYDPQGKEDKLAEISATYERCAGSRIWTVNHCSAYVASGYGENSENVNAAAADMIRSGHGKTGIMVMDFAGTDVFGGWNVAGGRLVDAIIENNWK
ncbi:MAG: hypothetical protein KBT08_01810 [Bacteroidales bacterium]|nr:hypothetical protein [Candidatus Cryptobacteroides onthequi]